MSEKEMHSSEQIRAYLLWLRQRGLQSPTIVEMSHLAGESSEGDSLAEWKGPIKVLFLSDLPLAGCEQPPDPQVAPDSEQKNLLDRMILAMQLEPNDYCIAAAFPPETQFAHLADLDFIEVQHKKLKALLQQKVPCLLITLGEQASKLALRDDANFLKHRGKIIASPYLDGLPVLSTLHPRDLLRYPGNKRLAWTDLKLGMQHLGHVS